MTQSPAITETGVAAFSPRARLLKLIGADLISDEIVAITELVKNAHDADATFVAIQFVGVADGAGEIFIRDDGHGMDLDTLLTRWMQPAGSSKGRHGLHHTPRGRRMLGEKGVGRFAADKLASNLELVSRCPGDPREIRALFDWDQFDRDETMLSDVRSPWDVRTPEWLEKHGTVLRLSGLRTPWNERMFRRLSTRLSRLVSPFEAIGDFRIQIDSDEFPDYAGPIAGGYLDVAPYALEATFDGADTVTVRVGDGKPARHTWPGPERLACGPVRVRLHAFDLETEALAKLGPRVDVRAWLREWSGVSVYRDGFRVWPYGEPHDDWLRLDQRRVNNPVVKLSNNQIVGFVEIRGDRNPDLRDQTNREGLIHNDAFNGLQRLIQFGMQLLEAERQSLRHPQGKRKDRRLARTGTSAGLSSLPDTIERLAAKAGGSLAADLRRTAGRARTEIGEQESARRRLLDGYSDLAATGHAASLIGRTVEIGLEDLRVKLAALRSSLGGGKVTELGRVLASIGDFERTFDSVASTLVRLAAPGDASRRRRGMDVAVELEHVGELIRPVLDKVGGRFEVRAPKGSVLRTEMRPEAFAAVMSAMVLNSIEWAASKRELRVTTTVRVTGDDLVVVYSDNGRGVMPALEASLFEPMVSGREGGAGMGLTLARHIVVTHGGRIALLSDRRRRGATFEIAFPRKRSRAT